MARKKEILFVDAFSEWIETYKEGAVSEITIEKYWTTHEWLEKLGGTVTLSQLDRRIYQKILNEYGKTHEKSTTSDFHTQLKACLRDLFHDKIIEVDPTYRAVVKGKKASEKKQKFLQKDELTKLIKSLKLTKEINIEWFCLITAKTGTRYAETLALTPEDFNWETNTMTINKTWDYRKARGCFKPTKSRASVRTIKLDWQIVGQFKPLIENLPPTEPIFIKKDTSGRYARPFNSSYNYWLKRRCIDIEIPIISFHALRHTHASVLLAEGVSIHTISSRLGHADVGVTQSTYAHVLDDLQSKDDQIMMSALMQMA